jgi:hypothetical protein
VESLEIVNSSSLAPTISVKLYNFETPCQLILVFPKMFNVRRFDNFQSASSETLELSCSDRLSNLLSLVMLLAVIAVLLTRLREVSRRCLSPLSVTFVSSDSRRCFKLVNLARTPSEMATPLSMWSRVMFVRTVSVSCTRSFSIVSSVRFVINERLEGVIVECLTVRELSRVKWVIASIVGKMCACSTCIRLRFGKFTKTEFFITLP